MKEDHVVSLMKSENHPKSNKSLHIVTLSSHIFGCRHISYVTWFDKLHWKNARARKNIALSNYTTAININFLHWFFFFPLKYWTLRTFLSWTMSEHPSSKLFVPEVNREWQMLKHTLKNFTWASNSKTYFEDCVWVKSCQDKFCLCHTLCSQASSAELQRMYTTQFGPLASAII